jgi:hypothetical protein
MEFQWLFDAELLKQFTTLVAAWKYQAIYLLDLMHPQNGFHSALSITLCQWLLCMLPLYIALLEHTTEGYCALQYTELLLPQNEMWRIHYQINCNDCKMSFSIIVMYRVVLFVFTNLLFWIYYHKLGKQMW